MSYQPAVGDVVVITTMNGDVGEVQSVSPGSVAVRVVQEDSEWYRQVVNVNAGHLAPVTLGR